jgi:hypothetical protein
MTRESIHVQTASKGLDYLLEVKLVARYGQWTTLAVTILFISLV